jgi:hypothetical protein
MTNIYQKIVEYKRLLVGTYIDRRVICEKNKKDVITPPLWFLSPIIIVCTYVHQATSCNIISVLYF